MNPRLITPTEIAVAMKMTEKEVWAFSRHIEKRFKPTRVIMIGSKLRPLDVPRDTTKKKLKLLHKWFQLNKLFHPASHGGIKGQSCFSSAEKHLGKKYVWTRDASNCYPSVSPEMFLKELKRIGFRHNTALLLTQLCTVREKIPQGSPVSNDAINLYFWCVDQMVRSSGGMSGISYTRVADDFVISGNRKDLGDKLIRRIEEEVEQRGIKINDKKRRKSGFQNRSTPQLVHNIRVDNRKGTKISNEHRKIIIELADSYQLACKGIQPSSLEAVALKRRRLVGYLHYCGQANLAPIKHIKSKLQLGDRFVRNKLKKIHVTAYKGKWWLISSKRNEPRRLATVWTQRLAF